MYIILKLRFFTCVYSKLFENNVCFTKSKNEAMNSIFYKIECHKLKSYELAW